MLKLLDIALIFGGNRIVLCPYKDEDATINPLNARWVDFKSFSLGKQQLEAVTLYDGKTETIKDADCYKFDHEFIKVIEKRYSTLINELDSIAVYKGTQKKWLLCIIFHEQMSLFRIKPDEVETLKKSGINYFDKPPSHW